MQEKDKNNQCIKFPSEVIKIEEIDGKTIVTCASPIFEIKKRKNGTLYKSIIRHKG